MCMTDDVDGLVKGNIAVGRTEVMINLLEVM